MDRVRVKVCCISSLDEARMAIAAGADAIGLVGPMPSGAGIIDDDLAREIASHTPPPIATFLLTSRATGADIVDHVRYCRTNTVQVVRHIAPGEYKTIAKRLPTTRRVQVIHIEDEDAVDLVQAYEPFVDAFLLDSGRPRQEEFGGTGRVHDWEISRRFVRSTSKPVFLAGGLHPDNVGEAIDTVQPFGVDLCSGLRPAGRLNRHLLQRFMRAMRPHRWTTGQRRSMRELE